MRAITPPCQHQKNLQQQTPDRAENIFAERLPNELEYIILPQRSGDTI
jgi:hypothetical protein